MKISNSHLFGRAGPKALLCPDLLLLISGCELPSSFFTCLSLSVTASHLEVFLFSLASFCEFLFLASSALHSLRDSIDGGNCAYMPASSYPSPIADWKTILSLERGNTLWREESNDWVRRHRRLRRSCLAPKRRTDILPLQRAYSALSSGLHLIPRYH